MKFSTEHAQLSKESLETSQQTLEPYRLKLTNILEEQDWQMPEASILLPTDTSVVTMVEQTIKQLNTNTLQYVIVIGIGGSNLGTQAIYEAIAGSMHLLVDRLPKVLFLDTVSDERMTAVTRVLEHLASKDDFLAITISKSGSTTETIANTEILWKFAKEQFGDISDRFVCITGEGSKLWHQATSQKLTCLPIPKQVGGRYSVMSAVGLLPLALAGIDIHELRAGAATAVSDGINPDLKSNHALNSACATYEAVQQGRIIHNSFFFSPKLETLGKWYRQLMGESIGKNGKGMTPMVSIGSTDLHSMAQLFWGGPDNTYTNLIYTFSGPLHKTPSSLALPGLVDNIQNTSLEQIMEAIYGGTKQAYVTKKQPFIEIDLNPINARELGYYLQFRMLEMMYLAQLLEVNAFDQPAVELYKTTTRNLLTPST